MSDVSAILALPYLQPAQAQKHVTHNEALRRLDAIVQLAVADRDLGAPPADPTEGMRHIVGPGATGDWAGHAGDIAVYLDGTWDFVVPQPGWQASVLDEGAVVVWSGTEWAAPLARLPLLGVNTTADATNRLAVSAPATLLTHAGAGHQLKLNKAAAVDTGSLLFQTGFSGRAEMGLAGSDDFSVKVSAEGSVWTTAMTVTAADGRVRLPAGLVTGAGSTALPGLAFEGDPDTGLTSPAANQIGFSTEGAQRALLSSAALQLDVPLTGLAVQSSDADITAGRLLRVGSYGLGKTAGQAAPDNDANMCVVSGLSYRFSSGGLNCPVANPLGGSLQVFTGTSGSLQQLFLSPNGSQLWIRGYLSSSSTWSTWQRIVHQGNLVGAVTQTAGAPTGAVIERGTNANGEFTRFADGTQLCSRVLAASTSAGVVWTFPAAFSATPVVTGTAIATTLSAVVLDTAPTATAATLSARLASNARSAANMHLAASGRWF